jgi:predicted NAD-dependent protein-ADP-ribosyltransferase YbiA (DUF1768 family)
MSRRVEIIESRERRGLHRSPRSLRRVLLANPAWVVVVVEDDDGLFWGTGCEDIHYRGRGGGERRGM